MKLTPFEEVRAHFINVQQEGHTLQLELKAQRWEKLPHLQDKVTTFYVGIFM
mgnify:CR=1 FL=1